MALLCGFYARAGRLDNTGGFGAGQVEKPFCKTLKDAAQIVAEADKMGVKVMVLQVPPRAPLPLLPSSSSPSPPTHRRRRLAWR